MKNDLLAHWHSRLQLLTRDPPGYHLPALQQHIQDLDQFRSRDGRLTE